MRQPAVGPLVRSRELRPTDPLTGFGGRDQLIDDLEQALDPESSARVLAVFELAGSEQYRRAFGVEAGDLLITRLATACARVTSAHGRCYRPRQDEFCVLVELPTDAAISILEEAERALREEGTPSLVSVTFGVALLPDEPSDAIDALIIADQHLDNRNRRERRGQEERADSLRSHSEGAVAAQA